MDAGRVGPYDLLEKLGEGGMGVVYRASDTRLGRTVALKFIKADISQRWEREARAVAALNHPNIATLYDVGEHNGDAYLAMELVEGAPLKGPLPAKETIEIGIQVAGALAAAHTAGIVHRDLKPGNILLTGKGSVKVLDFGLAKLGERSGDSGGAPTQTGSLSGSPGYISPEQLNGKPGDARSDVFAFGCILYELSSGRKAFPGESMAAAVTATLMNEPRPLEGAPVELAKLIRRCLRRDPERRPQHMDDVRVALEDLRQESSSGEYALAEVSESSPRHAWLTLAMTLAGVAAGAAGMFWYTRQTPPPKPLSFTMLTRDSGLTTSPAISRDGKLVAYASDRGGGGALDIWVQQVAGGGAIQLTHGGDSYSHPSFSADGSLLAYESLRGAVYVSPALGGGEPRRVASGVRLPTISPDGKWIAYRSREGSNLAFAEVATGTVYNPAAKDAATGQQIQVIDAPMWSPDSRRVIVRAAPAASFFNLATAGYWVFDFNPAALSQTSQTAYKQDTRGVTSFSDRVLLSDWAGDSVYFRFSRGDSVQAGTAKISANGRRLEGPRVLAGGGAHVGRVSAAADGAIVFSDDTDGVELWRLPVDTNSATVKGELQLLRTGRVTDNYPYLSLRAHLLAFVPNSHEFWTKDLSSGKERILVTTPAAAFLPMVSEDGQTVAYQTTSGNHVTFWTVSTAGGSPRRLYETDGRSHLGSWCPNGQCLIAEHFEKHKVIDVLDLATGKYRTVAEHPDADLYQGFLTPDMRWMVVSLQGGARNQLDMIPLRDMKAAPVSEWVVLTEGPDDTKARFSPDGKTVYYLSASGATPALRALRYDPQTGKPSGPPRDLLTFANLRRSPFDVSVAQLELTLNQDSLVFNQADHTGNIWLGR